jgi:hypothetical protein
MKQIPPKYNVPAQTWNRYLQNAISRLRYETDTGTLLLEWICSETTFILPSCGSREKGRRYFGSKIQDKEIFWQVSPGYPLRTKIRTRHFTRVQNADISLSHLWFSCLALNTAAVTMLPVRRTVCGANVNLFVYVTVCSTNTTRVSFATN